MKFETINRIVFTLLGVVTIGLFVMIPVTCSCIEKQNRSAHAAWCRFYNRYDITFEEWKSMKISRTLPGQSYDRKGRSIRSNYEN